MAVPSLSFKAPDQFRTRCVFIYGNVKDEQTNAPIAEAHVYTINGEEECFSEKRGFFSLKTWGSPPLYVHVKHPGYQPEIIILHEVGVDLEILLLPERHEK